jgi:hypothetical protein
MDSLNLKWRRNVIRLRIFFFLVSGMFLDIAERGGRNVKWHFVKSPILSLRQKSIWSLRRKSNFYWTKVKNAIGSFWLLVMFLMLWFSTKWCHFWKSDYPLIFDHLYGFWQSDIRQSDIWQSDIQQSDIQQSDIQQSDIWQSDIQIRDIWQSDIQRSDRSTDEEVRQFAQILFSFCTWKVSQITFNFFLAWNEMNAFLDIIVRDDRIIFES